MDSCMLSRSNRCRVRICVPDPALVCLQLAFGIRCYDWPPVPANTSELSAVAARERSSPSDQICPSPVEQGNKRPVWIIVNSCSASASPRPIPVCAERLQEGLGRRSVEAYDQPTFSAKIVITGAVSWINIDIVSTHYHRLRPILSAGMTIQRCPEPGHRIVHDRWCAVCENRA
jgi:hypothetical protein